MMGNIPTIIFAVQTRYLRFPNNIQPFGKVVSKHIHSVARHIMWLISPPLTLMRDFTAIYLSKSGVPAFQNALFYQPFKKAIEFCALSLNKLTAMVKFVGRCIAGSGAPAEASGFIK